MALKAGVDIVANAVKCTLGPSGRNVVCTTSLGRPRVTHDGVSVARDIRLSNGFLQTGAAIIVEACRLTDAAVGDGTTTAAVLTQAMTHGAYKAVAAGAHPMSVRRGIAAAVGRVDQIVRHGAIPIATQRERARVAGLSAHDAHLGELIAGVFGRYGPDAAVTVEDGRGLEVDVYTSEGMRVARGLVSPRLATDDERMVAELDACDVLVTDRELEGLGPVLPFLDNYVSGGGRCLVVIAKMIGGEVLTTLIENHKRGRMSGIAVRAPVFGARQRGILEDIAVFTGGTLVAHESGEPWASIPLTVLGTAARVRSDAKETIIVDGGGETEAIADRIEFLWLGRDRAKNQFDREKLEERIQNLSGEISEIRVGAATDVERDELRQRIEDAVAATRAALDEGVVAGGGSALARAAKEAKAPSGVQSDEATGWQVVLGALTAPLAGIVDNAGYNAPVVVDEVVRSKTPRAFDIETGEYVDPAAAGLVDPAKVVRAALRYAASAATMIITSNTVVADAESYRVWAQQLRPRLARDAGVLLEN